MYEPYRDRIVATEDFQDNFAMVDLFVDAVGKTTARVAAQDWCSSSQPLHRAAGLDVLCVLAAEDDLAGTALQAAAASVDSQEDCEDLRWSAAHGLACIVSAESHEATQLLLRFICDPDGDVRWQVAVGLTWAVATLDYDDDQALVGLGRLLQDPDNDVRARAERSMRDARARLRT